VNLIPLVRGRFWYRSLCEQGDVLWNKWSVVGSSRRTVLFLVNKFAEEKHQPFYVGYNKDIISFKETSVICESFCSTQFWLSLLNHKYEQSKFLAKRCTISALAPRDFQWRECSWQRNWRQDKQAPECMYTDLAARLYVRVGVCQLINDVNLV
jgi:hypothetical protein